VNVDSGEVLLVLASVCRWFKNRGYAYQVGGSFASSIHGVPRQTRDIDLVVDLPEAAVDALEREFSREFYVDASQARNAVREHRSFNLVHLGAGVKVDIFVAGDTEFDAVELERSVEMVLDPLSGERFSVKSAEDTVLRKLLWYDEGGRVSDQQWTDLLGVLKLQGESLDHEYLKRWGRRLGIDPLLSQALRDAGHETSGTS
jgi:hypothetical protein